VKTHAHADVHGRASQRAGAQGLRQRRAAVHRGPRARGGALRAIAASALVLAGGCLQPLFVVGGDSVYCGDTSRLRLHLARFAYDSFDEKSGEPVWASARRVTLGDPLPIGPNDIRDVRLVDRGRGGSQISVAGAVTGTGGAGRTSSSTGGPAQEGDWVVRLALSRQGASRLSEVTSRVSGTYDFIAMVVGTTVFTTAVDLPVAAGVATFDLPARRSKADAMELFRKELSCPAAPPSE
jgi:hypothetical protein